MNIFITERRETKSQGPLSSRGKNETKLYWARSRGNMHISLLKQNKKTPQVFGDEVTDMTRVGRQDQKKSLHSFL